ncbi:hypothetical protein [uncultured Mediterranean phage uvDeep-CGR2-AD3-C191]|nr:hypothetical protein [uncultured Mediterranean phage uvDeep-CGR2-AD3-C191]
MKNLILSILVAGGTVVHSIDIPAGQAIGIPAALCPVKMSFWDLTGDGSPDAITLLLDKECNAKHEQKQKELMDRKLGRMDIKYQT